MTTVSYDRYADTGRATLVPLLVDPATGRPRNIDLEVTPHLLVTAPTGSGATSVLRFVAAHTARHKMDVQIVDFKRVAFRGLAAAGLSMHTDPEPIAEAVTDFVTGLEIKLEALDGRAPASRRVLVVDGLERLRKVLVGVGPDRMSALSALEKVVTLGRAGGYHLVASTTRQAAAGRELRVFRDCSAVLTLGSRPAGVGVGEFEDYDGPGPVRTAYVTDDEARQLVTR
ncbi:hypothetical protein [Streptomyces sp. NPDC050388]|uniref:hypothetical protein n=1 Tax=Streptomyces sp. NPDC050388 TaxID=3155781 RepID=UPI00342B9FF8